MVRIIHTFEFKTCQYTLFLLSCSIVFDSVTPWSSSMPGFPVLHYLLEFAQTHVHWVNDVIQPAHAVIPFPPYPQSFPESGSFPMNQLFTSVGQSIGQSISPSNEYSGLISFRIDQFDLFAVQGTLKSLLQHHSSKQSFLWYSLNLIVQLFHQYMTTGKTIFLVYGLCQQNDVLAFEYTV